MIARERPVIGIDVGVSKGYHVVLLHGSEFKTQAPFHSPSEVAKWCLEIDAPIVAVDAPCKWASHGKSRLCERTINIDGKVIQCFKTPQEHHAHGRSFYDWVRHGQLLYSELQNHGYVLDENCANQKRVVVETFPHAVVCAIEGRVVKASHKATTRRAILSRLGYDHSVLPTIDHVDAALCSLTALAVRNHQYQSFGQVADGKIVFPAMGYLTPTNKL